jgi:3-hydroxyisobutyrate dehydrogenase-like beta-hydroxyacid dehydrogenase
VSDISIIGLGAMGSAIARTLLVNGRKVTVWNRSPEKMAALAGAGANTAEDIREAVSASPRVLVCLLNYTATNTLFAQESQDAEVFFNGLGAGYIDGTIMCWPGNIGTPSGRIAVAGAEDVFSDFETDLNILVGDLRNMGSNVRAAATLELAFLSRLLGIIFGSIHGALACEAEGVPVSEFTSILPPGDRAIPLTETIHAGTFETISSGGASVDVAGEAVTGLYDHAVSAGINSELPALWLDWVRRAQAAGYGSQETAAVIKELRKPG